ncbi:MAG: diacylglycerol kinase family protein [Bacteroidia bacterium]|jgi:diacylglycerol kinase
MSSNKPFKIHSRIKSFGFAFEGIATFFKTQHNAWIHTVAAMTVIALGFYFNVNTTEWCFLILAIALVMLAEMLNTAIEFLTDLASPEFHPLAKKVKDVAAGAVLFAAFAAVIIGILVFVPHVMILL